MSERQVLLVEDDATVRAVLQAYLELDGFTVLMADNGEQGLARARELLPDLIVSDVMMPRMDGLTMLQRLREDETTADIPVLLVSGLSDPGEEFGDLPPRSAFVTKPIKIDDFRAQIRSVTQT